VAPHINYNAHHMLVLRWFNMLTVQAGDNDCVGKKCSDIEATGANEVRRETCRNFREVKVYVHVSEAISLHCHTK